MRGRPDREKHDRTRQIAPQGNHVVALGAAVSERRRGTGMVRGHILAGWPFCPYCKDTDTYACPRQTMPYGYRVCRKRFSVRTGTALQASHLPLLKWANAMYLEMTVLEGVSGMKLHRDFGITQKTAWFNAAADSGGVRAHSGSFRRAGRSGRNVYRRQGA